MFVLLKVGTRRIAHFNVTANPSETWTLQQFREVMMDAPSCRFVLHDRDRIYSSEVQKGTDLTVPLENLEMFERMGVISPS
jgi:hypothetical protein